MIVDLAIVGLVGWFGWRGWRRGLVSSAVNLFGFIAATVAAVGGFRALSPVFRTGLRMSPRVADFAAAVALFAGVSLGAWLAGRAVTRVVRLTKWGIVNSAGGAALSGSWALAWVTVVLLAVSVMPAPQPVASRLERSALARGIVEEAPGFATRVARTDLRRLLALFAPHDVQRVSLVATNDYQRAPAPERELFDLVNEERRVRDLAPLRWDERLAVAGRAHAADMYARGYFSHDTPEGRTPGDRLRARDVPFRITGENIALAPTVALTHNRLMASARHRAHILDRRFTRAGVGVMFGRQGLVVAQEFAA